MEPRSGARCEHGYFGSHPKTKYVEGCDESSSDSREPPDGDIKDYLGKTFSYDHVRPCNCKYHEDYRY